MLAVLAIVLFLSFLGIPLLSLLFEVPFADLLPRLQSPLVVEALRLSVITSLSSTIAVVALGLPVALFLAMRDFAGKRVLEVVINLPMVLPPTVAGLGLLLAFGRTSPLGRVLSHIGINIPFTTTAVVLAQMFVAAPFFINAARSGFESVDERFIKAARTLRASPSFTFFRVLVPLSFRSLMAGTAMCWARALGEFGATITFAGNMRGRTQTMPLAVYVALQSDLGAAVAVGVILLIVAFGLLLLLRTAPLKKDW